MKLLRQVPKFCEQTEKRLLNLGLKKLKEPKNLFVTSILSIPLMILLTILSFNIMLVFNKDMINNMLKAFENGNFTFTIDLFNILGILLLVIFHELIHLIFIPNFISSKKTYLGFTWFGGFVYSSEEINKGRYLLITIAPYVVISVLLPIIFGFTGIFNKYLMLLILLNSLSSSVDILNLLLILIQVPNGSLLIQNGERTYFIVRKMCILKLF